MYNPKYFINGEMWQLGSHKCSAIHTFTTSDSLAIGMFQGEKGARPDLDFRVKILQPRPDAKPFLLPHDEWVVDMLIKGQSYPDEVVQILDYYLDFYEKCVPFTSLEERANYSPTTRQEIENRFKNVCVPGTMSVEGISIILELFCLCEKQTPDAHQFKLALQWTKECLLGQRDVKNLLNLVIRHREY